MPLCLSDEPEIELQGGEDVPSQSSEPEGEVDKTDDERVANLWTDVEEDVIVNGIDDVAPSPVGSRVDRFTGRDRKCHTQGQRQHLECGSTDNEMLRHAEVGGQAASILPAAEGSGERHLLSR